MSKEVANFKMKHKNGQTKSGNESTLIYVLVTMFSQLVVNAIIS